MSKLMKKCFLVKEIGEHDGIVRKRVNQWKEYIYKPALETDYTLVRADEISIPGHISSQIIDHIINDDLAIIDFTGSNPNVMYEAAIRHASRKPFIHIAPTGYKIPFDIQDIRQLTYDPANLKYFEELIKGIKEAVQIINVPGYKTPDVMGSHQFDLQPIIQDPKAFVDLLVEKLGINSEKSSGKIVKVSDGWSPIRTNTLSINLERNKIVCPNCGTINYSGGDIHSYTATSYVDITSEYHYKCNVCGTEF